MQQGQRAGTHSWQVPMAWSRCPQVASASLPRTRPDLPELTSLPLRVADSAGRLLSEASQGPCTRSGRVPGTGVRAPRGSERRKDEREGSALRGHGAGSLTASSGGETAGVARGLFNARAAQTQRSRSRAALSPRVQGRGRQGTLGAQPRVWKRRALPFEDSADT